MDTIRPTERLVLAALAAFAAVFVVGFVEKTNLFLVPLAVLCALGGALLLRARHTSADGNRRAFLVLTGCAALCFTAGVTYGVFGMWGYYSIIGPLFIGGVIASAAAFLTGVVGSLVTMRRERHRESSG